MYMCILYAYKCMKKVYSTALNMFFIFLLNFKSSVHNIHVHTVCYSLHFNPDRAGQLLEAKKSSVNVSQSAAVSVNRARLLR